MLSAWRQLRRIFTRDPKFTVLVVLTVMLGAGIATAVFTVFNHVLLRPLPVTNPEELVRVYDTQPFCAECPASFPKYVDWRERNRVFSAVGGSVAGALTMTGIGEPVKLSCSRTTASLAERVSRTKALSLRCHRIR